MNALHYAIIFKKKEIVKLLLQSGAKPDCLTSGALSPLHLAVFGPTPFNEGIELLLYKDLDINHIIKGSLKWVMLSS